MTNYPTPYGKSEYIALENLALRAKLAKVSELRTRIAQGTVFVESPLLLEDEVRALPVGAEIRWTDITDPFTVRRAFKVGDNQYEESYSEDVHSNPENFVSDSITTFYHYKPLTLD